uniref:Eukaryotic translation initiation factor 4E binding protein 1 n=1 Tax=Aotus nancymaae TaxID=37293 RepID=A0A2K5F4Q9_AOTNA
MSGGRSCSQTPVVLSKGVQLSLTPLGTTLFSTTPGGARITNDRKFLMECQNSPVTKTPRRDLPVIPGVTSPASQNHLRNSPEGKLAGSEESQFEMGI